MNIFFSALFVALFFCTAVNAGSTKMISSGHMHTCALDKSGVTCWGDNYEGESDVPSLKNPKMVVAGHNNSCAIDDFGLKCWGSNKYGQNNIPELNNPTLVSIGAFATCATNGEDIKCWGDKRYSIQLGTLKAKDVKSLSASTLNACAIDSIMGVLCWGSRHTNILNVPKFTNPKMVTVGSHHACVLDDTGVICWGENEYKQLNVPQLSNPKSISANGKVTCAIDDSGIKCWGESSDILLQVPKLKNPTAITVGSAQACALNDEKGVTCWGRWNGNEIPGNIIRNEEDWRKEEKRKQEIEEARRKAEEERRAREARRVEEERRNEEARRAAEARKIEEIRRSKLAKQIPLGSKFTFNKDVLVGIGKATVLIGNESKNVKLCLLIIEPDMAKERIVKAGREYVIRDILPIEEGAELETSFLLEGTPLSISCYTDYPQIATIGEITDSLAAFGVDLTTLPIPEPEEL